LQSSDSTHGEASTVSAQDSNENSKSVELEKGKKVAAAQKSDKVPSSNEQVMSITSDATCSECNEGDTIAVPNEEQPEKGKEEDPSNSATTDDTSAVPNEEQPEKGKEEDPSNSAIRVKETSEAPCKQNCEKPANAATIQDDCRTSVLIKKQMSEIDKEIHRRAQNKNIKKIDEEELAQLLSNADSDFPCSSAAAATVPAKRAEQVAWR
uniref:DEK_C domain-containing protein n=1 Tax=Gongylonema pulchrum TaxID=637853 RepID=A0A183ERK8_9BILA